MKTLIDLGERRILSEIIPRFVHAAGDDCASLSIPGGHIVATTDPVPPPAAQVIGGDDDPFWMGWLLVTINVSDLAASGASPLGFLAAIECEPTREVAAFERLLVGIRSACADAGIAYVGGNMREAQKLSAVGIGLGYCTGYAPLSRKGGVVGDFVLSVGQGGLFWRDALRTLDGKVLGDKSASPLFQPRSQIKVMPLLASKGVIRASMDNSDGLLPTLSELAAKSGLGIEIDVDQLTVPGLTEAEQNDAARMWFGWGDWNVIACVAPDKVGEAVKICRDAGSPVTIIGRFVERDARVYLKRAENVIDAARLESERFAKDSWMLKGIGEYVSMLRNVPLP